MNPNIPDANDHPGDDCFFLDNASGVVPYGVAPGACVAGGGVIETSGGVPVIELSHVFQLFQVLLSLVLLLLLLFL